MNTLSKLLSRNTIAEHLQAKGYIADIAKIIMGAVAIFASGQISIPIPPVPVTMQTVVIIIIAFTYSPRLSFLTVLGFISAGVLGLPMFTKFSSGLSYFLKASVVGYYLGFLIATPVMSALRSKLPENFVGVTAVCIIGHAIIYLFGVSWLATAIGLEKAIYSGFIVFIPSGLVKMLIFSSLFSYIKNTSQLKK